MLTIPQIKALKAEHLFVYRGEPGTPSYRVVWLEDGLGFADKQERLMYAHPADETGEEWEVVDKDFNPADYKLHTDNIHYGGHFITTQLMEGQQAVCTKVVKFNNPRPPEPGHRDSPYYVVFKALEPLSDEAACEQAIDLVLALDAGFTGDNAHPVLVI